MKKNCFFGNVGFLFLLVFAISCADDPIERPLGRFERGVLIVNEGAFGANDGELYHYNPESGEVQANVFENTNDRPFAGLIQQVREAGELLYLVANTGKVEIVRGDDLSNVGSVIDPTLQIPRDLVVAGEKLFISDFGPYDEFWNSPESFVAVVPGKQGGGVSAKISVPSRPEGMALINGRVWVACTSGQSIAVIAPDTEEVFREIAVPLGAPYFFAQHRGNWYLYAVDGSNVYFHRLNPATFSIAQTIAIPLANAIYNGNFTLAENGEAFIITASDGESSVAKVSIDEGTVLDAAFFSGSDFYGLGFDEVSRLLYVGDHAGWQGNGSVWVVNSEGEMTKTIPVGRGPSGFMFR
ncbi:surface layer protein [Lunatimonas salinarum]|uniref:surface layer protein n=1 Tax=Lunatimonas salinarum TaxID=1774590 RepID=UPI001AE00AF6|nr:surface layer protein [Lunatimonas salinarum]